MIMPFADYARRHHAKRIAGWLAQPGWRIKPHLILACWPQSDPIERLWGLMHREIPDKAFHTTVEQLGATIVRFLCEKAPRDRRIRRERVSYVSFHLKIFGF